MHSLAIVNRNARKFLFFACIALFLTKCQAQQDANQIALVLRGKAIDGLPLAWSPSGAMVLNRSGRMYQFDPSDAERTRAYTAAFTPASPAEMRAELYREFGRDFRISATSHYIVAHPSYAKHWPGILEKLHRSFLAFCTVRGIAVRKGRFPMVAIVFPNRQSFMRYAQADLGVPSNALGYYSRLSNRVALYDHGNHSGGVHSTIRHEAAHQSAFNSGLHLRVGDTPKWIVEGVGTLFEADGFYDASRSRTVKDRVAHMYAESLMSYFPTSAKMQPALESLIGGDRLFSHQQDVAYAVSWATAFYLADRRPDVFRQLVTLYTDREPFNQYRSDQRVRDFVRETGMSLPMFSAKVHQYVKSVQ